MGNFIAVDHLDCTGCKTCEMICSLHHFGRCNPSTSAIRIIRREKQGLVFCLPIVCQHCDPAPCIEVCPTGAICRDEDKGVLALNRDECSDCGLCTAACPCGCISIDSATGNPVVCDLCNGDPQCIQACHAACLTLSENGGKDGAREMDRIAGILRNEHLTDRIPGRRTS